MKKWKIFMVEDDIEEDLFQMDSFNSSDNNSKIILRRKFKKVLENVCEDIPVTFDSSSYKTSTDDNASDYDNLGLDTMLCRRI